VPDVKDTVIRILAEQALRDPSEVSFTDSLENLEIDSLGLVEAIFAIEEAFDVQVPFNSNDPAAGRFDISSVAAIVGAVEGLVAARDTAGELG
jgi:acyl carrier protein